MKTLHVLLLMYLYVLPAPAQYGGGSGTAADPYRIAQAADLILLGETPDDYDKHFVLTDDIDLDPNLAGRKVFDRAVIAPDANPSTLHYEGTIFTGVLDGRGHTIRNLTIRGGQYLGLFGWTGPQSVVKRLGLDDAVICGTGFYVGSLVGRNERGRIVASYSSGVVEGDSDVGGLVGCNECGSVTASHSSNSVRGTGWGVGGLVGINHGTIAMSYSTGWVGEIGSGAGGLVGDNEGFIDASYATGSVSGKYYIGGLAGDNEGRVTTSYSRGSAVGMCWYVGGLVGENQGSVIMSYSSGLVSGASKVGGLVGVGAIDGVVSLSFWDIDASGQTASKGGTGKSAVEMQMAETFLDAGWDFGDATAGGPEGAWTIGEAKDYPRLTWEYRAFCPDPNDGALDVSPPVLLSWSAASEALAYDIYFGQDATAVRGATIAADGVYRGRQAAGETTYDPGVLNRGQTYYWRIDELNPVDPANSRKGAVWSFTTADFIVPFKDAHLKTAVANELYVSDPTPADMLGLTHLSCSGQQGPNSVIADLTGLEYAVNLQSLSLQGHTFHSLLPLSGLTNLERLDLRACPVEDISPLAGTPRLSWLNLHKTRVRDISGLAVLPALAYLDLRGAPLNLDAYEIHIPQLRAQHRDITILYDPYRE